MQYEFHFTSFQFYLYCANSQKKPPQGILKDRTSTKSEWNFKQSDEQPPVDKAQGGDAIYHD